MYITLSHISLVTSLQNLRLTTDNTTLSDTQMLFVKAQFDAHIRFLNTLMSMKKIYEILDSIITKDDQIDLSKKINQANQESEMNVITSSFVRRLILNVMSLSQLEFQRMIMMTTNYKKTNLTSFVCFDFISEEILKAIKCFVESETYDRLNNIVNTFRLILKIS